MTEGKTISLEHFREKKKKEELEKPFPGRLVWLRCPKCQNIEYTEVVAPNGRSHKCGTMVEEVEVKIDLRAELTITHYNLKKIEALLKENEKFKLLKIISKSLDKALLALKRSEETYLERLHISAKQKITIYPGEIVDIKNKLPIIEENKLGLLISEFRFKPEKRFNLR